MSLPERCACGAATECPQFRDEELESDTVFDCAGYFFSHKCTPEHGLHIMVCTIGFIRIKTIPCPDIPGKYINGCYFTGTGRYMLDCTEAVLYENKQAVTDIPGFFYRVHDTAAEPFLNCPRRSVVEQFGCDYDAWLGRMMRCNQIESRQMSAYALEAMCDEQIRRGDI